MPNKYFTMYPMEENTMVIHHSLHLLEKLSEIEKQIRKFEELMSKHGIELDQDNLMKILIGQKGLNSASLRQDRK